MSKRCGISFRRCGRAFTGGQPLVVEGAVSEKDNLDKDEAASFRDVHHKTSNWGVGAYSRSIRDGNLDAVVSYTIARA